MLIDVITIFPKMFDTVLGESIIKRAINKDVIKINIIDLRDFSKDKHRKVDDKPFGGGPGMIMKPEPFFEAVRHLKGLVKRKNLKGKVILMGPQGAPFNQQIANRLSSEKHIIIICGHYEGIDERVRKYLVNEEISIGDFILTGGELPAMVIIDAVVRLSPGGIGNRGSCEDESFTKGLLEYPHYTRPANYKGMQVPEVLLRGNHKKIEEWRECMSLNITKEKRPDMIKVKSQKYWRRYGYKIWHCPDKK